MNAPFPVTADATPPTSPPGPPLRWLWTAIGVLGAGVLALGAALVVQQRSPAPSPVQAVAGMARTPEDQIIDEKPPSALYDRAPYASELIANSAPGTARMPPPDRASAWEGAAAGPAQRAQPVRMARAPVCGVCGQVESVQPVQQGAPATGVGAVAGGVLGAVVGNQVGRGSGRTAATVLGAVGGGYLGHTVEQRTRTQTVYDVRVRMDDGSVRHFRRAQSVPVGAPVTLQGKGFRLERPQVQGGGAQDPQYYPAGAQTSSW